MKIFSLSQLNLNDCLPFNQILAPLQKKVLAIALNVFSALTFIALKIYRITMAPEDIERAQAQDRLKKAKKEGSKLEAFEFSNINLLTEKDLIDFFKACPNLSTLTFSSCDIDDRVINHLPNTITGLTLVNVGSESCVKLFKRLSNLEFLSLVKEDINNEVSHLPSSLKTIQFINVDFSQSVPLDNLPGKLANILLNNCKIYDKTDLQKLPKSINVVYFSDCLITDQAFSALKDQDNITFLSLRNISQLTSDAFKSLPSKLKKLIINKIENVNDSIFDHLPMNLKSLLIANCSNATITYKHLKY